MVLTAVGVKGDHRGAGTRARSWQRQAPRLVALPDGIYLLGATFVVEGNAAAYRAAMLGLAG